jgi:4-hydroxy-tetrahydrodipicolinate reductase
MIKVLVSGYAGRMGAKTVEAVLACDDMQLVGGYDPGVSNETAAGARLPFLGPDGASLPLYADLRTAIKDAEPDVVVDFSVPSAVEGNVLACIDCGVDCVVGTTGLGADRLDALAGELPEGMTLFVAPNFTTGAVLMAAFAKAAARYFPDAEVVEYHHNRKADAPSGTAISTARAIAASRGAHGGGDATPGAPEKSGGPAQRGSLSPGKETELPGYEGARGAHVDGVYVHSVRSDGFVASQSVIFGSPGQTLTIRHDSIDRQAYMPGVLLAIRSVGERSGLIVGLEQLMGI